MKVDRAERPTVFERENKQLRRAASDLRPDTMILVEAAKGND